MGAVLLNLGCGSKKLPGFVNVDGYENDRSKPDVLHDLTKPLPWDDGTVDEVHAYHVIEHFHRWEVPAILTDWARVLKPGGKLVLECPCLNKVLGIFNHFVTRGEVIDGRLTMWALYGDPNYKEPAMCHKWCYSVDELQTLVSETGLTASYAEPQTHIKVRDMRIEGIKDGTLSG